MKIIVDAFGGDNAPIEILKGCQLAVEEYNVNIIATGNKKIIEEKAKENNISLHNIEIVDCDSIFPMKEEPTEILKKYSNSSMAVGLKLLSEDKGDAFISAGSTGGLVVGSSFIVKRIKGIKRAAISTVLPTKNSKYILIDSGANNECRPEMLLQFGLMGSIYMEKVLGVKFPKIGLVNIGTEETKGTELQVQAYKLLENSNLNFFGNVESREIPNGICDVVVCDGFVGNIILKYTEGLAKTFSSMMKDMFTRNIFTKMSALILRKGLDDFRKNFDYTEYGGAVLMGIRKPVIKAHGSSNAKAIKNSIRQAISVVENNTIQSISDGLKANLNDSE